MQLDKKCYIRVCKTRMRDEAVRRRGNEKREDGVMGRREDEETR